MEFQEVSGKDQLHSRGLLRIGGTNDVNILYYLLGYGWADQCGYWALRGHSGVGRGQVSAMMALPIPSVPFGPDKPSYPKPLAKKLVQVQVDPLNPKQELTQVGLVSK